MSECLIYFYNTSVKSVNTEADVGLLLCLAGGHLGALMIGLV